MTQSAGRRAVGRFLVISAVIAASTLYAASGASAGPPDPPGHNKGVNHCVNSFGVDYNELFGSTGWPTPWPAPNCGEDPALLIGPDRVELSRLENQSPAAALLPSSSRSKEFDSVPA